MKRITPVLSALALVAILGFGIHTWYQHNWQRFYENTCYDRSGKSVGDHLACLRDGKVKTHEEAMWPNPWRHSDEKDVLAKCRARCLNVASCKFYVLSYTHNPNLIPHDRPHACTLFTQK
ncbi:MAG: hypothetical protein GY948_05410 [Alphaproteobacteria bacterium]|nr:hypothetical protein [Alphaproteobacteria bacterium]